MNPNPPPGGNYPGNRPQSPYPQQPYPQAPGYPQAPPRPYGMQAPAYPHFHQKPFSTKAIVSMVMGGVGFIMCPLGAISGIVGVVLGIMGMKESKEPGGTHRGYGLALGGTITSAIMFLLTAAGIVFFVWAVVEEEQRNDSFEAEWNDDEARRDMEMIHERLQLYYIENGNSLDAGGPVVRDGWASSYGDGAQKVSGRLQLTDLVHGYELTRPMHEYSLEIRGRRGVTIRNDTTGTTMKSEDVGKNHMQFESRSKN